ncbi:hypothetical protein MtrunA17_Chr5g0431381 [Medicago truncatula]|uniref:Uncharacterized protein n=1 Tax=Medicago truncatula TaxID=3880 RepID=A0A396HTC6_MEDTR|nr:hypothetical protein MtrunA17_Chr5g0431381 [Medicago truncatula]
MNLYSYIQQIDHIRKMQCIFSSMFNTRDTFVLEVYSCIIREDNALNYRLCRWAHSYLGET